MAPSALQKRLESCTVVEEQLIKANPASVDLSVALSPFDIAMTTVPLCVSSVLLYPVSVELDVVVRAAHQLVWKYPLLAGRYRTDLEKLTIECNNAGMPLTFVNWPEGRLDLFPGAMCFQGWQTELPATLQLPANYFVDDMNGFETVFNGQPLFKLRHTTLGDGGCLLSLTVHHAVVGGARIGYLQYDLARACKGEALEPLEVGVQRDLLSPRNLAKLLPQYKDILQPGHGTLAARGPEPGVSFEQRWKRTFGASLAEMPSWPIGMTAGAQSYSFACIEIPGCDLEALQQQIVKQEQQRLSKNDILMGLVWTLRCVFSGAPLPGQVGSANDFGVINIDLGLNNLGGALGDLFGNTATSCLVTIDQLDDCKDEGPEAVLLKGVGLVAVANRQTLQDWRRGGASFKAMLQSIAAPNKLQEERHLLDRLTAEGRELRCIVTNLAVFGGGRQDALATLDCGRGPPVQFFVIFDPARERWAGVVPSGDGDGVFLQLMVPADAQELVQAAGFFETLIPHARFRGLSNGVAVQPAADRSQAGVTPCGVGRLHARGREEEFQNSESCRRLGFC